MSLPPPTIPNPWVDYSDEELHDVALTLNLACGRAKAVLKQKRKSQLCGLILFANDELDRRGKPRPVAPFKA